MTVKLKTQGEGEGRAKYGGMALLYSGCCNWYKLKGRSLLHRKSSKMLNMYLIGDTV